MPKVIIIGGGFGGINAAKALKKADVELLVIDKANHHLFQPLLYQVATAALSMSDIASPIREILKNQSNTAVLMAYVDKIDLVSQQISTSNGKSYPYDYLIIATGSQLSYFGHNNWEAYAPGVKTLGDAVRIREHILCAFEKAEVCEDPVKIDHYLNFAVVGAGPTGVEMAGSIAEFAHLTLYKNFRLINPEKSHIYLIEGANQVLPSYPAKLGARAKKDLEKLGVEVMLNTLVTDVNSDGIHIKDQFIPAQNIIWAAGNQTSPLLKTLNVSLDRQGRVNVEPDLSVPGHPNVFVIGDAACSLNKKGEPLPGLAPAAIQQGLYVAKLIKKNVPPADRPPFVYFDKGMLATIGRGKAVGVVKNFCFSGFFAWMIWCCIHIFYLISFRNRVLVMFHWLSLYITNRRQARIIVRSAQKK